MNILAVSGSLRKGSYNTALIRAMQQLAPKDMQIELAAIDCLPLFSEDLESDFPQVVKDLKAKIEASDGIIFATPEYNRSIPGVLKNAIDWASRPYGQNSFRGKPVLIAGVTVGRTGAAVAQSHLRVVMQYLDTRLLGQPELYWGPAADLFNEQAELSLDSAKASLADALRTYKEWIER